jgi:GH35 family endo-1,4-beta-xylanase
MYDGGIDGDYLKEVVDKGVKRIDIGAAVLPKPLLNPDVDEIDVSEQDDDDDDDDNGEPGAVSATIIRPEDSSDDGSSSLARKNGQSESREGRAPEQYVISPKVPTRYARTLRNEFNAVVVEHHLKWAPLCVSEPGALADGSPSRRLGRYDFHHADAIVDYAIKHNMKVKGHVLVWHVTSPTFLEEMSPEDVREQLRRHIFTTMGHFRGRIMVWDVVNEALAPDGSLAHNVFYRKLGPGYIDECFRWAHQADADAILLYNDNKVEGMNGPNKDKADGFYKLLAGLVQRGVPIHGCGIQAHFNAAGTGRARPPTPRMVKNQIHRLGQLGLKVNISEMDVRVSQLPPNLRSSAQRQIYHDIIAAALTEPAFDGVWLWGFTDRHTWVTHFYEDDEPLIFDEDYGRKDAYYGLRDALSTITPGGVLGGRVPLDSDEDEDGNPWGYLWMQPETQDGVNLPPYSDNDMAGGDRPDWELT